MKRYIFFIAAALLAAVSCSKIYDATPVTQEQAIGFGTWAENLTKARTPGQETFGEGDTFEVYGFKVNGGTNNVVFNGDVVTYGTPNWTYTNTRYWDPSATSYTFYGVSPSGVVPTANVAAETGAIAATSITFDGNNNDILVANKKVVVPTGTPATYATSPVQMDFKHIASLVDFKVKKHADLNASTVNITGFSITNIDNAGNFAVTTGYTDDVLTNVTWTATGRETFKNNSDGSAKHGVVEVALPTGLSSSEDSYLINNLVIMPQTFRSGSDENIQMVNIAYTITDAASNVSTYSSSFELKSFDNVDDTDNEDSIIGGWEKGKHYTFVITINANAIKFTGNIVNWVTTNATGYHYLVN